MFWKTNSDEEGGLRGYVGHIFEEGRGSFSLGLYRDPGGAYYTWFWDEIIIPPILFMIAINEFVGAAQLPVLSDHATIVIMDLDPGKRNHIVPMPLNINENGFLDGIAVFKIQTMRIDIPDPMPLPRETKPADGAAATQTPVDAPCASFLVTYDGPEVHLAIAGAMVPAEHIARFYVRTTGRILLPEHFKQLVHIIHERSFAPAK